MSKRGYTPNSDYTQKDWDAVSDNPELTEEQIRKAVPFGEAFPELAKTMKGRGRQKAPTKVSTTIRLSPEVLDHFKRSGRGWQSSFRWSAGSSVP